jgi:multidrug efflux pump subunit AcrA (membrane-fusion protein)
VISEAQALDAARMVMQEMAFDVPFRIVRLEGGWVGVPDGNRPPGDPVVVVSETGECRAFPSSVPPEVALAQLQ